MEARLETTSCEVDAVLVISAKVDVAKVVRSAVMVEVANVVVPVMTAFVFKARKLPPVMVSPLLEEMPAVAILPVKVEVELLVTRRLVKVVVPKEPETVKVPMVAVDANRFVVEATEAKRYVEVAAVPVAFP